MEKFLDFTLLKLGESAELSIRGVFMIALYFFIAYMFFRWVRRLAKLSVRSGKIQTGQAYAVTQISKYVIATIFVVLALSTMHVDSNYLAFLAPLVIGFGLAIQPIFYDVVSGIILLIEPSIRVSDIVEVDDVVARVKEIGLRTSKVESREGIIMIIPNHKLVGEKVTNWSADNRMTRFSIDVGVAYGSDVEKVKKLLVECAWKHSKIKTNPQPEVWFSNFGDSALEFKLLFWSNELFSFEDVMSDLRYMIDAAFREHDIHIPFPQRDIHVKTQTSLGVNPSPE